MFPRGTRLMGEVTEVLTIGRQIRPPGEDTSAKPGTGFVAVSSQIPPSDMRPVTRPSTKHGHHRRLSRGNTIDARNDLRHDD